jgi:hypothetical protein
VKTCFKCGVVKEVDQFYKHAQMADGHLGKCKDCAKLDVRFNRRRRLSYYKAYDRARQQLTERRKAKLEYQRRHRAAHPDHNLARRKVAYALLTGRLTRKPCEICGAKRSEAHHPDHSQPLNVRWLCITHHRQEERRG